MESAVHITQLQISAFSLFLHLATTHSVRHFSQISDDDRMSLTTAISDEDDGESIMASPYKAKATGTAAASFNCTGAVRKAG